VSGTSARFSFFLSGTGRTRQRTGVPGPRNVKFGGKRLKLSGSEVTHKLFLFPLTFQRREGVVPDMDSGHSSVFLPLLFPSSARFDSSHKLLVP